MVRLYICQTAFYSMNYSVFCVLSFMTLIVLDFPSLVEGKDELILVKGFHFAAFFFNLVLANPNAFIQPDLFAKHSSLTPLNCQPGWHESFGVKGHLDIIPHVRLTSGCLKKQCHNRAKTARGIRLGDLDRGADLHPSGEISCTTLAKQHKHEPWHARGECGLVCGLGKVTMQRSPIPRAF